MTTPRRYHARFMTMIEIIVAMSILVVIMWVVMRTFQSTQQIWQKSRQSTEGFEQARLVLDVVSRDLRGLVVSPIPGESINYTIDQNDLPASSYPTTGMPNSEGSKRWLISFVTTSGFGLSGTEDDVAAEVGYFLRMKKMGVDENGDQRYDTELYRVMTPYGHANCNFVGDQFADVWGAAGSWDESRIALIANNIAEVDISGGCYDRATGSLKAFGSRTSASTDSVIYPRFLKLDLTMQADVGKESDTRAFSKTIYFPGAP